MQFLVPTNSMKKEKLHETPKPHFQKAATVGKSHCVSRALADWQRDGCCDKLWRGAE